MNLRTAPSASGKFLQRRLGATISRRDTMISKLRRVMHSVSIAFRDDVPAREPCRCRAEYEQIVIEWRAVASDSKLAELTTRDLHDAEVIDPTRALVRGVSVDRDLIARTRSHHHRAAFGVYPLPRAAILTPDGTPAFPPVDGGGARIVDG